MDNKLFKSGEFFVGCNYWASHAGTNMWHEWDAKVVESDFKKLAEANIKYLRIFPLWPDFQPIKMLRECRGVEKEISMGENFLPHTEAGRAGLDEVMLERFGVFCDLAEKYGLKLVVGLVTGWMSGRLYVPELFEGVNVIRDARAIKWQIKFVKYMVKHFKDKPAIVAWDLGNECNCMGDAEDADGAYLWASAITMAIKTEDNQKPVISGMHSTFPETKFKPSDLGEILDVLCTHPYPLFTPHCMTDAITEQKSVMHSVAETVMYRGLSGKPAFAEEVGTLGPMIASKENAADYANTILHLLWAHDCLGFMWWCGFEQNHLTHAPYDWNAVERELGLFNADFSPKPVVKKMTDFANFIDNFEYKKLPQRLVDAVCIVSAENDSWLSTYGAFILAKQAGLDIEFCHCDDAIPEARAYILPSVAHPHLKGRFLSELMKRVENGAALYVSMSGNGMITPFEPYFGFTPLCHYNPVKADTVEMCGETYTFNPTFKIPYEATTAKVLATDQDRVPVMSENKYGKGTVYYLTYPLEEIAGGKAGVISGTPATKAYYKIYEAMTALKNPEKVVVKDNPYVAITEHIVDEETRLVVAVNCVPRESVVNMCLGDYAFERELKNQDAVVEKAPGVNGVRITMKPNSAVVFEIKK